mgnify:CR=1 FL=1
MKAYFEKTNGNNVVIVTDGDTAKVFDGAPDGTFEGVDLYADNTEELLKNFEWSELDYNEMYSGNELYYEDIEEELKDATLIFESK